MAPYNLKDHIDQAMGRTPADLVIKNIQILNVVTGKIKTGDIAISGKTIIGTYDKYQGKQEIDGTGLFAVPGFIDTHLHVESSLVTPLEYDRLVLSRGTTTAFCDPHEIANVIGADAFDYFLKCADATAMDLKVNLSSCVPATPIGTSGANITAADIARFKDRPHAWGLAEVMNIPGVANNDPNLLAELELFTNGHVDGHMPGVGLSPDHGPLINALAAANIKTDHECTTMAEALAKQERGVRILIREGTGCKNLEALMPFVTTENSYTTALCTDDFHPADIVRDGHINFVIRKAIELYDPAMHGPDKDQHIVNVYRMASYAAAQIFGLNEGLARKGEIAPGAMADIVLLNDLEQCSVAQVVKSGKPVNDALFDARPTITPVGLNSVKVKELKPEDFRLKATTADQTVIKVIPDNVLTGALDTTLPMNAQDELQPDPARDILKAAVIERHGRTQGNIGIGFVQGFQFKEGAIAATVGHDDHNITVVGVTDEEMALAANTLRDMGGGYVVVKGKDVLASLPLPVAGLMSDQPYEAVAQQEETVRTATKTLLANDAEGLPQPLISMAFISLSVIPDARLCDAGLTRNDGTGPRLVWDQRKNSPAP